MPIYLVGIKKNKEGLNYLQNGNLYTTEPVSQSS